jgi:hypothetical protein
MHITGGCHCDKIRYEAQIDDPRQVSVCHCTDCQSLTGSPFRTSIRATPGTFRIITGAPRVYTKTAQSGRLREQAFCGDCGSPIYATAPGPEPRTYNVRVGTIAERRQLRPFRQIWARSRIPWLDEIPGCPEVDEDA